MGSPHTPPTHHQHTHQNTHTHTNTNTHTTNTHQQTTNKKQPFSTLPHPPPLRSPPLPCPPLPSPPSHTPPTHPPTHADIVHTLWRSHCPLRTNMHRCPELRQARGWIVCRSSIHMTFSGSLTCCSNVCLSHSRDLFRDVVEHHIRWMHTHHRKY